MKKHIKLVVILIFLFGAFIIFLPFIKIKTKSKLIEFSYKEDFSKYEQVTCYDDGYSYYEKEDITLKHIEMDKFLFFYKYTLEYEKGNKCATEYLLEEDYIKDFINNAVITYNSKDIDLFTLIQNKEAIIGNNRYVGNDYETCIEYILNDRYETMYIFYLDDLLVIQVGHIDEGPKFIAYR